jgi:hypothetical protein
MDEIVSPAMGLTMPQYTTKGRARKGRAVQRSADTPDRIQAASAGKGDVIGRTGDEYVVTTADTRQRIGEEFERARTTAGSSGVDQVQNSHWGVNRLPSSSGMCL